MKNPKIDPLIENWLASKNWKLLPFQQEAWQRYQEGKSGLISVPTGAGKTYAAYLPALAELHSHAEKGLQIFISPP